MSPAAFDIPWMPSNPRDRRINGNPSVYILLQINYHRKMNITEKFYVAEWSHSQQQYHYHTVENMLESNNDQHDQNKGPDYIPLGFFETPDEASKFIDSLDSRQGPKQN